jgi:hypothetical protein
MPVGWLSWGEGGTANAVVPVQREGREEWVSVSLSVLVAVWCDLSFFLLH